MAADGTILRELKPSETEEIVVPFDVKGASRIAIIALIVAFALDALILGYWGNQIPIAAIWIVTTVVGLVVFSSSSLFIRNRVDNVIVGMDSVIVEFYKTSGFKRKSIEIPADQIQYLLVSESEIKVRCGADGIVKFRRQDVDADGWQVLQGLGALQ
jgi:hypothetical protein